MYSFHNFTLIFAVSLTLYSCLTLTTRSLFSPGLRAVIEEANWLTLYDDIEHLIGDGFDAVICLGNSFAHMLDNYGDQREQKLAIANFERCVRPGGLLLIDHRNYDNIMDTGSTPAKSIYYNVSHSNLSACDVCIEKSYGPENCACDLCAVITATNIDKKKVTAQFFKCFTPAHSGRNTMPTTEWQCGKNRSMKITFGNLFQFFSLFFFLLLRCTEQTLDRYKNVCAVRCRQTIVNYIR